MSEPDSPVLYVKPALSVKDYMNFPFRYNRFRNSGPSSPQHNRFLHSDDKYYLSMCHLHLHAEYLLTPFPYPYHIHPLLLPDQNSPEIDESYMHFLPGSPAYNTLHISDLSVLSVFHLLPPENPSCHNQDHCIH